MSGVAGFIGSHLLEALLGLKQRVVGLDNFATGHRRNLEEVGAAAGKPNWKAFRMIEGDLRDPEICRKACDGVDFVLHHAALASVPESLADPIRYHDNNVTAFLNLLLAAKEAEVKRFVFASSSAVYGDDPGLPAVEEKIGKPLSPYAASKAINEVYSTVAAQSYGLSSIGFRYFNIFGPRQDPQGAYAAVIPRWTAALLQGEPVYINGDGETTRDFCYVENVVQANLLAATTTNPEAINQIYNIGLGHRTTLNELFMLIESALRKNGASPSGERAIYREFRPGDVRHSVADIGKAARLLGYAPAHSVREGLDLTTGWYLRDRK